MWSSPCAQTLSVSVPCSVVAEAESARQYQRLEDAAKRRQQRAGAEVWRGVDLQNARVWKEREKPTEAWAARYGDAYQSAMDFLKEREAEEEKQGYERERAQQRELEQARSARRYRVIKSVLTGDQSSPHVSGFTCRTPYSTDGRLFTVMHRRRRPSPPHTLGRHPLPGWHGLDHSL
jgi:hypothetical protein